jgi:hypothetical protein
LLDHILNYVNGNEPIIKNGAILSAFIPFVERFKIDAKKYDKRKRQKLG